MTVTNTIRLYGVEPHNKWGILVWGTDTWAQQDIQWTDYKSVVNTMAVSSTNAFQVEHLLNQQNVMFGTIISREFPSRVFENLSLSSKIVSVYRLNNGWYSQRGGTINALSFPVDTFTQVTDPSTIWTESTQPTTTWVQS
jgi:hypothetical protein